MKYNIEFKCGHNEEVALFGSFKDREREIERLQECNCSACRKLAFQKKMSSEYDEVRMSYSEYKKSYSDCKTLNDSYDKKTKTIVVFVKKQADDVADDVIKEKVIEAAEQATAEAKASIERNAALMTRTYAKAGLTYDKTAALAKCDAALAKLKAVTDAKFFKDAYDLNDIKATLKSLK